MKKLLATLLFGAALALAALPVWAQGTDSAVTMTANAQGAAVSLALPAQTAQGVRALRLSFAVESSDPIDAVFDFDSALPGTVQQYRYDAATGRMNIYLAGGTDLFPEGSADLGSIRLEAPEGSTARVTLVEDSLELVNAAFGKTPAPAVEATTVDVTVGEEAPAPTPDTEQKPSAPPATQPTPQPTTQPAEQPSGEGSSGQNTGNGNSSAPASQSTQTAAPQYTTTPVATAAPSAPATGTQQPALQSGGSKKPAGSSQTGTTSTATPAPGEEPDPSASPAPSEKPQSPAQTATPEQTETAEAPATGHPPVVLIVVGCLAVLLIIGLAVLRFRSR